MFEEYLKGIHAKEYIGIDDDMPDAFDNWLTELDVDEWLKLGDEFKTSSSKEVAKLEKLPTLIELIK